MPNNKIIDLDRLLRFKQNIDNSLEDYAKVDGNYPTLHSGLADNLFYQGAQGSTQTKPFVFQPTGTDSNTSLVQIGNYTLLKNLRGNSVVFNQLAIISTISSQTVNGVTLTNNGNGSVTLSGTATADTVFILQGNLSRPQIRQGDKVLITNFKTPHYDTYYLYDAYDGNHNNEMFNTPYGYIKTKNSNNATLSPRIQIKNGATINETIYVMFFNLTLMFGAGNEPTSVLEFNRLFPKTYYPYNEGTLLSCKSNGLKVVGYNAFDSANPNDFIRVVNGQTYTLEGTYTSVELYDYNQTLLTDTFTSGNALPNNCCYVKIIGGDNTTCFHLTWDGSRTGYEAYTSTTYPLPNVELRSALNAYDEITPSGTLTRRMGVVDLGTLPDNAFYPSTIQNKRSEVIIRTQPVCANVANNVVANAITTKYITTTADKTYEYVEGTFSINKYANNPNGTSVDLYICDNSLVGMTVAQMKVAMSGVYLFYELDTPIVEETGITFAENMPVDDFGTQEFLYDNNIDIPIPQGNESFYPPNYTALVDQLYRHTGGDAEKLLLVSEVASVLDKTLQKYTIQISDIGVGPNGNFAFNDDLFQKCISGQYYFEVDSSLFEAESDPQTFFFFPNVKHNDGSYYYFINIGFRNQYSISYSEVVLEGSTKEFDLRGLVFSEVQEISRDPYNYLTEVKIGGTQLRVSGPVYRHTVRFGSSGSIYVEILNHDSDPFSKERFAWWLYNAGHRSLQTCLFSTGYKDSTNSYKYPTLYCPLSDKSVVGLNYGCGYYSTNGTTLSVQSNASAFQDFSIGSTHNRYFMVKLNIVDNAIVATTQFAGTPTSSTSQEFYGDDVTKL